MRWVLSRLSRILAKRMRSKQANVGTTLREPKDHRPVTHVRLENFILHTERPRSSKRYTRRVPLLSIPSEQQAYMYIPSHPHFHSTLPPSTRPSGTVCIHISIPTNHKLVAPPTILPPPPLLNLPSHTHAPLILSQHLSVNTQKNKSHPIHPSHTNFPCHLILSFKPHKLK